MMLLLVMMMAMVPAGAHHQEPFACNMNALNKAERTSHLKVSRQLMAAVEEQRELANGYAFRLPVDALASAAEWVSLERRCCPFFAFEIEVERDGGPLWLRLTGREGVKPFIRSEFGLE